MASSRPFQLLIKPVGADCNLRCDYCFYLRAQELYEKNGRHLMSDDVLERMVSQLLGLNFEQSVFAWQGGEPTLAGVDFFQRVVAFQQKHGQPGQSVSNSLQTNGVLINEAWCRLFQEYNFLIGLSMDGPQEVHDAVRKTAGGHGTWEQIMESTRLMDRFNVSYNVLCVVNKTNVDMSADLLRWFVDHGFYYLQFIPCFEPGMQHNVPVEAYGQFLCDTFDYWAREGFGKVSVRDFDSMLTTELGLPGGICTFGRKCNNYIVIEHTGDVYPCDFFVFDEWKMGNIMDAPLESFIEHETYRAFSAQKQAVPLCKSCEWRKACYGGCQKDRRLGGGMTEPSPFCPAYKMLFAHAKPKLGGLAKRVRKRMAETR